MFLILMRYSSSCLICGMLQKPPNREFLKKLKRREREAQSALKELESERLQLDKEIQVAESELKQLDVCEQQFWQEVNQFEVELSDYQNELESINLKYEQASKRLNALTKTNLYNDAFRIWHDGLFGTINGIVLLTGFPFLVDLFGIMF